MMGAYILFAFARDLTTLFVARIAAGFFAANVSTAQAYIADITAKEKRSIGMGLIGAAFGLGFIVGPVLGALAAGVGNTLGSEPPFGMQFATIVAAGLNLITFTFAYFMLPETLKPGVKATQHHSKGLAAYHFVFRHPLLAPLMLIFLLQGLAMALMEVMLFVFVKDRFAWDHITAGYAFAYIGIIMVLVQGYFIRKWLPRFGEKKVLLSGLVLATLGFFAIGPSHSVAMLAVANTFLAVGVGCLRPPIMGIASVIASDSEQGFVMGVMQSMSAIGRIIGPIVGGWLYQYLAQAAPFIGAGILSGLSLLVFLMVFARLPSPQRQHTQASA